MSNDRRELLVVAGVGRSGTSLFTTSAQRLGFHVPQPEIMANDSNPRGFGEPRWAVEFHERLMRRANIFLQDTRPAAWRAATETGCRPEVQEELDRWLSEQLDLAPWVAVKDPRITWFVDLYADVSPRLGARASVVTALRHPVETTASRQLHYGTRAHPTGLLASWLNQMLHLEQRTRDRPRAYVRYAEMLTDWRSELERVERHTGLPLVSRADESRLAEVDQLVDPSLRRARATWEGLDVPQQLVDLAEDTWAVLCAVAEDGDQTHHRAQLDELRGSYRRIFKDARAVVRSVIRAQERNHADALAALEASHGTRTGVSGTSSTRPAPQQRAARSVRRLQHRLRGRGQD